MKIFVETIFFFKIICHTLQSYLHSLRVVATFNSILKWLIRLKLCFMAIIYVTSRWRVKILIHVNFLFSLLQEVARGPSPMESFAWKPSTTPEAAPHQAPQHHHPTSSSSRSTTTASSTATTATTTTSVTSSMPSPPVSSFSNWNGTISHFAESRSGLPVYQSPTITLLQKSRGMLSRGIICCIIFCES